MIFMQRGQAFETIMMVIAVIVALAILGFLTGILGNLGSMFNPSDPVKTMTSALQGIAGSYSSGTAPQVLSFSQPGQKIDTQQLTQSTSLSPNNVVFCLTPTLASKNSITIVPPNSAGVSLLTISSKVTVEMVACGNPSANLGGSSGTGPLYVIALGSNGDTTGTSNGCYYEFTENKQGSTCPTS